MGWIDRVIRSLSPRWAASRESAHASIVEAQVRERAAKIALEKLIGYKDARRTRLDPQTQASGAAADWTLELGFDRRDLVDVARQLERDNALACSLLDRSTEHVVGEGFQLKCKTKDPGWNREMEQIWQEWCLKDCDSRGLLTFPEMLATIYRSEQRDGDILCVLERDGSVRLVESDEIASPQGGYFRPSDADGVELDKKGRITNYWVFDYDPTILWPDRRRAISRLVQVPAADAIFVSRRQRSGQTRGISAFTGITWLLEQLDEAIEAVAVAHRMAACVGLVFAKKSPFSGATLSPNSDGNQRPELLWEPGMSVRVDPDESVTQISPAHPSGTFEILCNTLIRFAAARFGLALEMTNFDFSKSNYSNMRAAHLEAEHAKRAKQAKLKRICSGFFGWKLANAIRNRDITPRKDAALHGWNVPAQPWVDPEAEVRSAQASIDGVFDTRTRILARRGLDFDETVAELAHENDVMKAAGLPDLRSGFTRDAVEVHETIKGGDGPKKNGTEKNGLSRLLS